jgi:type VI secretion system protein ImpA
MHDTTLLEPVSAAAPCGPDLEYDPSFLALEARLEAVYAERLVGPEGEDSAPDWKSIADQASELMTRSRDLRVAVVLTKAWLHLHGIEGLTRGLLLVQQLLSLRWGSVHPQLGAQGDTDGLMRVNALRSLCDARSVLARLRSTPLVRARGMAELSLRELDKSNPTPVDGSDATAIEACFIGCEVSELIATCELVSQARGAVASLEQLFTEHGLPVVLRLNELAVQLDLIQRLLTPRVRARQAAEAGARAPIVVVPGAEPAPGNGGSLQLTAANGELASRDQVVRLLDQLCAYYERHEPSSPVPILLRRAKRLTGMQFIDIVRNLAPGGLAEIETLRGPSEMENQ